MSPIDAGLPRTVGVPCPAPDCDSRAAAVVVRSDTVVTFRCLACRREWCADIRRLPDALRAQLPMHNMHNA
jgi:hypothetical protein